MEITGEAADKTTKIGPDLVTVNGQDVIIDAKHAMPDWDVRDINQVPIYFEENKYYLVQKQKGKPSFAVRYVLARWPDELSTCAKGFHSYDSETVAARDAAHRGGRCDDFFRALLLPFYPFLGFLWSGTQKRLVRFGFLPHAISGISIFIGFSFLMVQGVFAVILINTSIRTGKVAIGGFFRALSANDHFQLGPVSIPLLLVDILMVVALTADVVMRYTEYLREDEWAGGFLEWLKPRSKATQIKT